MSRLTIPSVTTGCGSPRRNWRPVSGKQKKPDRQALANGWNLCQDPWPVTIFIVLSMPMTKPFDFLLTTHYDKKVVLGFLKQSVRQYGLPEKATSGKSETGAGQTICL
jgi:hypothetical protein